MEWLTLQDRRMSTMDFPASRRAMASWRWWCVSYTEGPPAHAHSPKPNVDERPAVIEASGKEADFRLTPT
jgi:hypothetical protein